MTISQPREILKFWSEAGPEKWWQKDLEFDREIKARFTNTHNAACQGELDDWLGHPDSALALIIVLDQFSRNLYRNDPRAFAQDERCRSITKQVLERGLDRTMQEPLNQFCYLPLMHSENLEDQNLCLAEMEKLKNEPGIDAAIEHRDIIARFGRFPHRNTVLNRITTPEEQAFLDAGGFSG